MHIFQKHNKNEFLCLRDYVIVPLTLSCTKNFIFAEKKVLDNSPTSYSNNGVADIVG